MNILMLNHEYPPLGGGGGIAARVISRELLEQGHVISYVTSQYADLPHYEEDNGIRVLRVHTLGRKSLAVASYLSLVSYVVVSIVRSLLSHKKSHFDIVFSHFAIPAGIAGLCVSKLISKPHVLYVYGGDIYDPSRGFSPHKHPILRSLVRAILRSCELVFIDSQDLYDRIRNEFHYTNDNLKVVPIPYEPFEFNKATRSELKLSNDNKYVVTVGRLVPRKSFDKLIRAMKKVSDTNVQLIIIGDGPQKESLENLIHAENLDDKVSLAGFLSDTTKFQLLAASDAYILTSDHEGFGISLQEAMQVGLPLISTINGGQRELIQEDVNAIILKNNDPDTISHSINTLFSDKKLYDKLRNGSKESIKQFHTEKIVSIIESELEKIHHEYSS